MRAKASAWSCSSTRASCTSSTPRAARGSTPSFAADVPGLDVANVYLADVEDQPFRWALRASPHEIEFEPPPEPYGLFVLVRRGDEPPLWLGATGLPDGERFSLAAELTRSKRTRVESQLARYRRLGFTPDARLAAQIGAARDLHELVAAGDALELAHARRRPVNGAQRMGCDATKMYHVKPEAFRARLARLFDCATVTFYPYSERKLEDFEPTEGQYEFGLRDLLIDQLERLGVAIEGRPLLWLHSIASQPWMAGRDLDWLLARLRRFIPAVAGRYGDRIATWEVVNELHDWADVLHLGHDEILAATRLACELTAAVHPGAERLISGTDAFGVYAAGGAREDGSAVPGRQWTPLTYFRDLLRDGVDFDAVGVQIYAPYRDLTDTVAMLERYESLGKPVIVTELGVPSEPVGWHAWTPEQQADWAERMYTVLMSRPAIAGALWYDLVDVLPFLPGGGLLDADCRPKPAYERIERLFAEAGRIPA